MAQIAKKVVNIEYGIVGFDFVDGTHRDVKLSDLSEQIRHQLVLHGLSQKLGDSYSGAESVSEAVERFNSTADMLLAGDWTSGRSANGGIFVDALAKAGGVERNEALEKWNAMSDDEKAAIKKHPAIKAAKAAIELERAAAKAKAAGDGGTLEFDSI